MARSNLSRLKWARMLKKARPYLIVTAVLAIFVALSLQEDGLFRRYEGAVAAFSLILAVVFAFDAKLDSNRVSESLSTRYVGQFPHNLRNLTSLVRKARRTFFAHADCVDYGSFFEPLEFESFLSAVERKSAEGVAFTFLVLGKPKDISGASSGSIEKYVPAYCAMLEAMPTFMSGLEATYKRVCDLSKSGIVECPEGVTLEGIRRFLASRPSRGVDMETLSAVLHCFHEWTSQRLERANARIIVKHQEESPKFFFWLADEEEAMFELLRPTDKALGFTTHDTNLVDSLGDIWYQAVR